MKPVLITCLVALLSNDQPIWSWRIEMERQRVSRVRSVTWREGGREGGREVTTQTVSLLPLTDQS